MMLRRITRGGYCRDRRFVPSTLVSVSSFFQLIREALVLLLEQHPPLLRALLDTHDALLVGLSLYRSLSILSLSQVYCSRYSSTEAELSVGMRESDLRAWMHEVDIDSRQVRDALFWGILNLTPECN